MLLATDAPLDARQLRRLALRAGAGLARTGSVFGHGSGDIALAFSTAYTLPQRADAPMPAVALLHDALLDPLFQAAADSTEQAILHALWRAQTVTGRDGHVRRAAARCAADFPTNCPHENPDLHRHRRRGRRLPSRSRARAGNAEYERARRWMTEEANAAIAGAFDGGATRGLGERFARRLPQPAARPARSARAGDPGQAALPEHGGGRGAGHGRRLHGGLPRRAQGRGHPGPHHQQLRLRRPSSSTASRWARPASTARWPARTARRC